MKILAEQKYFRTSPQKLRLVSDALRKITEPERALAYLEAIPQRAARPLAKVLKQAVANAKNNFGVSPESLVIQEIVIMAGPTYKRGRPVARGIWHPIQKRTSHIRVVLETVEKVEKGKQVEKVEQVAKVEKKGESK